MKRVIIRILFSTVLIPLIFLSSGCTTLGPSFTKVSVPGNKAVVYVYRLRKNSAGGLKEYVVHANGRKVANLYNNSYIPCIVRPGLTEFKSRAEYTSSAKTYIDAGKTYYLRLDVKKGGLVGRPDLKFVDAATGEQEIAVCRLTAEK